MYKESIYQTFCNDYAIGEFVQSYGHLPELSPQGTVFEAMCKSIVSQQLSTFAAHTIYSRFSVMVSDTFNPESILRIKEEDLRDVGLSYQKINYIKNVCEFWMSNIGNEKKLFNYSDSEIIQKLIQIKGVGEWTVHMLLIFHFQRPNVLPLDDLIVRNGIIYFYKLDPGSKNIIDICKEVTQHWQPYASYGSRYMWAFKDKIKLKAM
jgi:DNA-3-methyladenine glycosylase II